MSEESEKHLAEEEAIKFFSEFYRGEHHIPGYKVYEFGRGWMVKHDQGDLATFDFNGLTRLVLMAHRDCYRASIANHGPRSMKICIWKRQREGSMTHRHPTIEQAIEEFNKTSTMKEQSTPPRICSFKEKNGEINTLPDEYAMAYEPWCEEHFKENNPIHTIEVEGKRFSVGDETEVGSIKKLYFKDNRWRLETESHDIKVSSLTAPSNLQSLDDKGEGGEQYRSGYARGVNLIAAMENYIHFLAEEYEGLHSFCRAHNWKDSQEVIDKGIALRNKINELRLNPTPSNIPAQGERHWSLTEHTNQDHLLVVARYEKEIQSLKASYNKLLDAAYNYCKMLDNEGYSNSEFRAAETELKALSSLTDQKPKT